MARTFLVASLLIGAISSITLAAEPTAEKLAKADQELLLGLIGHPLTEPTGNEFGSCGW